MKRFFSRAYRFFLILILLGAGAMAERTGLIHYLSDPYEYPYILSRIWEHICIVGYSMSIATVIGIIAGILLTRSRFKKYAGVVMYVISLGQTIPSLAVLALAMSVLGIGSGPAVFALTIYSILPIARNTLAGITNVPPHRMTPARGWGMSHGRILMEIEVPNAMKVIITGFRIALIINIGTVALAYLIGAGGMGDLIFTGIEVMMTEKLLAGAIPVTIMALVADFFCGLLELLLVSKGLRLNE